MTLRATFKLVDGHIAEEESWATNFSLGPLVTTDVPVAEGAPSAESYFGTEYEGTLGLVGLKRLDFIVANGEWPSPNENNTARTLRTQSCRGSVFAVSR